MVLGSDQISSCFHGFIRFLSDLPALVGQQCPKFCKAAQQLPGIVGNIPPGALAEQTPTLVGHLGIHRSIALLAGADATVLAQVLRDLPPSKRSNLANVAEHANIDALLGVVHGEIDPALLVHYLQHVPPASMVQLLEEVPQKSLIPLMTRVNKAIVIELLNSVDAWIISRVLNSLPAELNIRMLDKVADGLIDVSKVAKLLRGIDTSCIVEMMKSVPESRMIPILREVDPKLLIFMCASVDAVVLARVISHVESSKVLELIQKVGISRITGFMQSRIDPMLIVDLVSNAPIELIVDIMQKVDLCRTIALVEGADAHVLAYVLREVPSSKCENLIAVVANVNIDALLNVVRGEIDAALIIHYIVGVLPLDLVKMLEKIPCGTLALLMTRLDPTATVDLINKIDASTMIEVVCNVPEEQIITILDNIVQGLMDSSRVAKFLRGVETKTVIELLKNVPIARIVPLLRDLDAHSMIFICDSVDANVLVSLILHANTASVIDFVNRVDVCKTRGLLSSDVDPFCIVELVNNAPLDSIVEVVQSVDIGKMAFLLREIPIEQVIKLMQKVPPKELASLLSRVDAKVVANVGGSTSATLLGNLLKVCRGRAGSQMLKLAPKTIAKVLPAMKPISPKRPQRRSSLAESELSENSLNDDFVFDSDKILLCEDSLPELTLEDFLADADFKIHDDTLQDGVPVY